MFCGRCGERVYPNARFCHRCGAGIQQDAAWQPAHGSVLGNLSIRDILYALGGFLAVMSLALLVVVFVGPQFIKARRSPSGSAADPSTQAYPTISIQSTSTKAASAPPTVTATRTPLAALPQSGVAGTVFLFEVPNESPAAALGAGSVVIVDERGLVHPGRLSFSSTRVSVVWSYDSTGADACNCTVRFLDNGQEVAFAFFTVTKPTVEQVRAALLDEIARYDREVYQPYAPKGSGGDWRAFNLKMETWLPQHPEFARFYTWTEQFRVGLYWWIAFDPQWMRLKLDEQYLAELR